MTTKLLVIFMLVQTVLFAQTAPNLIVTDLNGTTHNLYNYLDEGKTVILDFFIINCTSCQDGAPYLDEFWNTYGPNGSEQIQVISLEVSNATNQQAEDIAAEWGIGNPIVNLDETPSGFAPFIQSYPTYLVVCPDKSMTPLIDFEYPQTILSWEQNLNICNFGNNITDANILANAISHCEQNISADLVVGNVGTNLINSFTIDVFVDSVYYNSIVWDHALPPNSNTNETPYPIIFESSNIEGDLIEFSMAINEDINTINNSISHNLNDGLSTENTEFTLIIQMDNYPSDLIWSLTNANDAVIFEGMGANYSPYQEVQMTILLESDICYTFSIIDNIGDGLCCSFGEGYFNILSGEDTLIANFDFQKHFIKSFYVGNEIGIAENTSTNKRIVNRLYYNIMGQAINYPTKKGLYLQQSIFEDGSFSTEKMMLTNN